MSGLPVDWRALNVLDGEAKRPGIAQPRKPLLRYPRVVLEATRVLYRALNIHHTTARMAAIALWREGFFR